MSHSRFRFLCRWWYHDQIGRNHDCRWSDRLNDKHDHFLLRDHLSGYRTQKGNTLREKKITRRHLVWVFAVVAVIVDIVVVLFSIACVTEAQTRGEGWRGGGGKAWKGKGRDLESCLRQLNHLTKFSVYFSVTAHYIYSKIRSFMQGSPIRVTVQIFLGLTVYFKFALCRKHKLKISVAVYSNDWIT